MLQLVGRSFVSRLQQLFPHLKHPMLQQVRHPQLLLGEDRLQKLSATPCQARPGTLVSLKLAPGACRCLLNFHSVLMAILLCDLFVSYPPLTHNALMLELAACLSATWHLQANLKPMPIAGWDGQTAATCGETMLSQLRNNMLK